MSEARIHELIQQAAERAPTSATPAPQQPVARRAGETRPTVRADARRRGQVRARSQPRHRGAAAEPADQRHRRRERAVGLPPDADLARSATQTTTAPSTRPARAARAARRRRTDDDLQRRHRPEHSVGRRQRSGVAEQQPAQRRPATTRCSTRCISRTGLRRTRSRCCANFKIDSTRQQLQVTKLNRDISDVQLRATDHQHAVERPQRVLGLRVRRAGGRSRAAVGRPRRASWCRTTRRASRSARWRRSTSCRRSRAGRDAAAEPGRPRRRRRRTAELALKRLIVAGTQDPNWNATLDPVDRPDFQPRADRHRGGGPARAQRAHRPRDREEERRGQRRHLEVPARTRLQPQADLSGALRPVRASAARSSSLDGNGVHRQRRSATHSRRLRRRASARCSATTIPRWTVAA